MAPKSPTYTFILPQLLDINGNSETESINACGCSSKKISESLIESKAQSTYSSQLGIVCTGEQIFFFFFSYR